MVDQPDGRSRCVGGRAAYLDMRTDHPLTLTVEQAAQVLGVGRSTAYELVRSGELKSIRLRRRIVVPVAHLAERLGVDRADIWSAVDHQPDAGLRMSSAPPACPASVTSEASSMDTLTLF